ncbi:Transmembrane domain-containing protein [Spironucleus salmonicida]|uniref:Transmembrane domain-containing protein n=1 Tax=Spironucleus salmonicida TaxID=348837 RepID=V6LUZ9_9EUKA|nr:Transmembrane domain-containing protein [Spironucleus salmonicida]|eukprot:EST48457.1 Transmembrane domain-containing protein [Spironucleus salmonicida]
MEEYQKQEQNEQPEEDQHNSQGEQNSQESQHTEIQQQPTQSQQQPERISNKIYKILNILSSLALIITAQIHVIYTFDTVHSWFVYLFTVSAGIINLSISLENLGIRYYFGLFYNKYLRALSMVLASAMNLSGVRFCDTKENCVSNISSVVSIVINILTMIIGIFVIWPDLPIQKVL